MKEYSEKTHLDDIWSHLENFPSAHLATIDGGQPRVRPMALIALEKNIWLNFLGN